MTLAHTDIFTKLELPQKLFQRITITFFLENDSHFFVSLDIYWIFIAGL
jgi:hypothetical protein